MAEQAKSTKSYSVWERWVGNKRYTFKLVISRDIPAFRIFLEQDGQNFTSNNVTSYIKIGNREICYNIIQRKYGGVTGNKKEKLKKMKCLVYHILTKQIEYLENEIRKELKCMQL